MKIYCDFCETVTHSNTSCPWQVSIKGKEDGFVTTKPKPNIMNIIEIPLTNKQILEQAMQKAEMDRAGLDKTLRKALKLDDDIDLKKYLDENI